MEFNMEHIRKNSNALYGKMKKMYHYTFNELQKLVGFESTELCFAILQLLQENKISQEISAECVCYTIV